MCNAYADLYGSNNNKYDDSNGSNAYADLYENHVDKRLKRCPFCGGEAGIYAREYGYEVECTRIDCRGSTGQYDSREEAIESWNRRFDKW